MPIKIGSKLKKKIFVLLVKASLMKMAIYKKIRKTMIRIVISNLIIIVSLVIIVLNFLLYLYYIYSHKHNNI